MNDPRYTKLAELLIHHSTDLQAGEHILIEAVDMPREMVIELVKVVQSVGGNAHVALRDAQITSTFCAGGSDEMLETWSEYDLERMKRMDAYIALRGSHNISEAMGIPADRQLAYGKIYGAPVHMQQRLNHTKWCVLR